MKPEHYVPGWARLGYRVNVSGNRYDLTFDSIEPFVTGEFALYSGFVIFENEADAIWFQLRSIHASEAMFFKLAFKSPV